MIIASSKVGSRRARSAPWLGAAIAFGLMLAACESESGHGNKDARSDDRSRLVQPSADPPEPWPSTPRIGAYYFGSFSSVDYDPQIVKGGCEIYGHDHDVWSGVRDFHPDGARRWLLDPNAHDAFRHLEPAIGYYDLHPATPSVPCASDTDPLQDGACVVYRHIQQAKRFGLSYFSFYWFWDDTAPSPGRQRLNDGLESFHKVRGNQPAYPLAAGFDFYLTIAQMPRDLARITADQGALDKLVAHFESDYYLKPLPNRPLLFILDSRATAICQNQLNTPLRLHNGSLAQHGDVHRRAARARPASQSPTRPDRLDEL